jgi:hypothetical protein
VQNAAVTQVDLGGLHLSFAQILVPGLELPHHEKIGQEIEVAANGGFGHPHGASWVGRFPDLTMVVGEHGPESQQRRRRNRDSQLRDVPLQESPDVLLAPR